jgi:hypothetical protein
MPELRRKLQQVALVTLDEQLIIRRQFGENILLFVYN